MEDDRRVDVPAGPDEATLIYLDAILKVLIEREGFETTVALVEEVSRDLAVQSERYAWTEDFRRFLRYVEASASRILDHHEPIQR